MCDLPAKVPFLRVKRSGTRIRWGSVTGATKYFVETRVGGGPWLAFPKGVTRTSAVLPSPMRGIEYWYRVRAWNSCGYGVYSDTAFNTVPNVTAIGAIEWVNPHRSEPGLYPTDPSADYMKQSGAYEIDVNGHGVGNIYFKPNTSVGGVLFMCNGTATESVVNGVLTFTVPKNSIVFGDGGTHWEAEQLTVNHRHYPIANAAATKVFVETMTNKRHQLDKTGVAGFASKGFNVGNFTDPISVQTLRRLGFVNEQGILSFSFVHVVSGTGHAFVYLSTSDSVNVVYPPPATISAMQSGWDISLSWDSVVATTTVYRRVDNGEWRAVGKVAPNADEFFDINVVAGATYCYKVGTDELPESQSKACVFVRSI